MWIGSIDASDEHCVGTPLGVVKAKALAALPPEGQRLEPRRSMICKAHSGEALQNQDQHTHNRRWRPRRW